jgi:hypothetical protein
MARTMEQIGREIDTLKAEVEILKQREESWPTLVRQFAGCFTGDAEWEAIHAKIEAERRQPDPRQRSVATTSWPTCSGASPGPLGNSDSRWRSR